MPFHFRLKKGLLGFAVRLGILNRPKGEKIHVKSSGSRFPARKSSELQEDVLCGGVLAPSEQLPLGVDSLPEKLQCLVAVIRQQELVIDVSEPSQEPPADPDHEDDLTPLMVAAGYGNLAVAKQLVETYRCDVNEEDSKSCTPVMYAAELGHLPVLKMLKEHGANVLHKESGSVTALHLAAWGGSIECVEYLLPLFGDRKLAVDEKGWTCLHFAVWDGSVPVVRYLVDQCGFDLGIRTADDETPLMLAAAFGHLAVAKLLIETYRCNANEENSKSMTPVMYAAQYDHLPVLKMLIEHGANVLHKRPDSSTALHLAAYGGSIACLKHLLPLFEDRWFELDENGWTCLHYAVWGGSLPVMRYLVNQCGFDLGLRTAAGHTPLMLAAVYGRLAVAKLLVKTYKCDVNKENSESVTPVMFAAQYDHLPVLKMLKEHGANVLHKGPGSLTALHLAAYGGSIECVEYLLPLFGDRRFEMDEDGSTCLHYAVKGGSIPVMRYLVDQCGFDLRLRTARGQDCFLLACKAGHQEIVCELLARDEVDQNVVDEDGRGALHLASTGGHAELLQLLVGEYGFPDTRDNDGRTPLDLAPDFAQDDIVEAALQYHESFLKDVCWIPSGIKSLFITPNGGEFPLVPVEREEDAKQMIQLCVPSGAVRADGEGVEVRYAVIPDGPFQIPEGYKLCSPTVYIKYSQAQTTKPFLLSLPHWSGAADHPVFVTSPHTLPEGEQYYPFHLLEGGEFGEGYGIVEVDGHCSLFGLTYGIEDTSRYYASLWEREERNILHSKVAVTFKSNEWMRYLRTHWTGWKKRFTESFEMKEDHIEGCLTEDRGRGWHASRVGKNWVGPQDIEYVKKYKSDENELQYAVEDHLYPPAICHDVVQSEMPRHLQSHKRIYLHIHGAKEGDIPFPINVLEEKEASSVVATHLCLESGATERPASLTKQVPTTGAPSVVSTHLCLESGSTERPVSLTQQAPTTGSEMEVTQSRSEAAVSDRDPLSQPVHCCKRYAVLFRKHVSRQGAGKGKAVLEFLGLTPELIDLCYEDNPRNEEEAIQVGLKKWQTIGDHCTWQDLLEAMKFAGFGKHHCSQLVQELHQWMQGST